MVSDIGVTRPKTRIDVVGAVIVSDGLILIAKRSSQMSLSGLWEFPGGKIEAGEAPEAALKRELAEELRCEVEVGELLEVTDHACDFGVVRLHTYFTRILCGEPVAIQHDELRWIAPTDLMSVDWAPADIPTAKRLRVASKAKQQGNRAATGVVEAPARTLPSN